MSFTMLFILLAGLGVFGIFLLLIIIGVVILLVMNKSKKEQD